MTDTSETPDPQMPEEPASPDTGTEYGTGMTAEAPPPVEPLSLTDKFVGILTEPGPTYENVRAAGSRASDWLIPVLLLMILLAVGTLARFANPEFLAQVQEQQERVIQQRVDSGDMTQKEADQARQQIESMKGMFGIFGAISAAIGYFIYFFIIALVYWLIVRFIMRGEISYSLVLSAIGLSTYILLIDQLVSLLLTFVTGKPFANLSPALFMDIDMASMSIGTKLLLLLNPIQIWGTAVLGIGFEKIGNISRTKGMIAAFSLWIVFTILLMSMGRGM